MPSSPEPVPPPSTAFLLTQVGTHAANRFAERVAELGVTPPQVGLLRHIASNAGLSQQAVAEHLGMPPSRIVGLVDDLESRNILERKRDPQDRRNHALHLTPQGMKLLADLAVVGKEHEAEITAALDERHRSALRRALEMIASDQGLTPGVHPGFRRFASRPGR